MFFVPVPGVSVSLEKSGAFRSPHATRRTFNSASHHGEALYTKLVGFFCSPVRCCLLVSVIGRGAETPPAPSVQHSARDEDATQSPVTPPARCLRVSTHELGIRGATRVSPLSHNSSVKFGKTVPPLLTFNYFIPVAPTALRLLRNTLSFNLSFSNTCTSRRPSSPDPVPQFASPVVCSCLSVRLGRCGPPTET